MGRFDLEPFNKFVIKNIFQKRKFFFRYFRFFFDIALKLWVGQKNCSKLFFDNLYGECLRGLVRLLSNAKHQNKMGGKLGRIPPIPIENEKT